MPTNREPADAPHPRVRSIPGTSDRSRVSRVTGTARGANGPAAPPPPTMPGRHIPRAGAGGHRRRPQRSGRGSINNNPLRSLYFTRRSTLPLQAKLMEVEKVKLKAIAENITASFEELATRLNLYTESLPKQVRWQSEYLIGQMASSPEIKGRLDSLMIMTAVAQRMAVVAERLAIVAESAARQQTCTSSSESSEMRLPNNGGSGSRSPKQSRSASVRRFNRTTFPEDLW